MGLNIEMINNRLNASTGAIAIESSNSVESELMTQLVLEVAQPLGYQPYYWNISKGLQQLSVTRNLNGMTTGIKKTTVENHNPDNPVTGLFKYIRDCAEPALFLVANLQEFLPGGLQPNLFVLQDLMDLCSEIKRSDKRLILVGDRLHLSHHFDGLIYEMTNPLPTEAERQQNLTYRLQDIQAQSQGRVQISIGEAGTQNLIRAMGGITKEEADDLLLEAAITHRAIDDHTAEFVKLRRSAKLQKRGVDILQPPAVRAVGLENLDRWLDRKAKMFAPEAQRWGLDLPNGCLIVGSPGTGKTLTVKNMAKTWEMPVFVMNVGRMMSKDLGGSEENMERFLKEIEFQTGILFIDELDKQFAAIALNTMGGDGGTSQRMFGVFLQWLNDKREKRIPIFVAATANRVDHLPSEFLRDGRWDAKFYVGLPKRRARAEILSVHLERRRISFSPEDVGRIAAMTEGFNGAELEQLVITCAEEAYIQDRPGQVSLDEILRSAMAAPVQSRNPDEREKQQALEDWARRSAIPASLDTDESSEESVLSDRPARF
ncbi:MAG: AAA family ATPase [Oculatellaceae cyanobacterium Prado106]|jgi:SpoVK/Ycf46/Vps4 family AAA+-type ATPase|nr:AAA family ATPase [Oculatellaceae cyanobacterium Prado106]